MICSVSHFDLGGGLTQQSPPWRWKCVKSILFWYGNGKKTVRSYTIISTIVYCATHGLALRGESSTSWNTKDLIMFRFEGGAKTIQKHIEEALANALMHACPSADWTERWVCCKRCIPTTCKHWLLRLLARSRLRRLLDGNETKRSESKNEKKVLESSVRSLRCA